MSEPAGGYVEGRSCEGCTMCCKLLRIEALDKPSFEWCPQCDIGVGCKIYEERPSECRVFHCGYVTQNQIGSHWKPANSRMVVALTTDAKRLTVFVDPDRPEAWRKEPFYSDIKDWARAAEKNKGRVVISQGSAVIAVTPGSETNLGAVKDGQIIIGRRKRGPGGTEVEPIVIDRDDPIVDAMKLLKDPEAAKRASPDELAEAKRQVDAWLAHQDK